MYEYEKQSYNESVMMMHESGQPVCAQCGAAIFPGAGFCRVCGAPVVSRAGAVPPPPMPGRAYAPPAAQRKASSSSSTFAAFGCAVFLVSVFLASFLIVRNIRYRNILDRMVSRDVRALADDFFRKIDSGDYKNAYAMFDEQYPRNVDFDTFERGLQLIDKSSGRVRKRELKSVSRNIFLQNDEKYTLYRLKYETQHRRGIVKEELLIIESAKGCILRAYIGPWTRTASPQPPASPRTPFTPRQPRQEQPEASREDPSAVAEQFFKLLDDRDDSAAYRMLDDDFQKFMSFTNFKKLMTDMRKTLGARRQKALTFNSSQTVIQGNKYSVVYQLGYTTKFEKGIAQEEIVLRDVDGKLMVDDYKIISTGLKTPERKTPAPGTPETMPEPEQEPEQPQTSGPRTDV